MNIDPAKWPQLSKLLDEVLELSGDSRSSWLDNLGTEHSDLVPILRQLLALQGGTDHYFPVTLPEFGRSFTEELSPGQRLDIWQILSVVGRGGMGTVYRAERADGKFDQRVAIKVLSCGLDTAAAAHRFQQEYRILASLEHPNVARLLDAGTTENGLPYFVMEYVEGRPIDRYCAERNLSVSARMRLVLPVCDAVQFAHQILVVHRDLKPDNILVTEQGVPKLLDFGIAKVLNDLPSRNEATLMALTPEYASPEQVRGDPVGTATDVYSLGCVVYKLLTGSSPHQLRGKSLAESVRSICEDEPVIPSSLNPALGLDEDNVLRMAMRKDAQSRYRSVEQFGADINRYLRHEPILARPASAGYRLQKYIRRHRVGVAAAATFVLLVAVFGGLQAAQLRRTSRERDRADRVTQFMSGMFRISDPGETRGNRITAREILDKASADIEKGLASDPELQAEMMSVMGQVYGNLGLYPSAQPLLERSLEIRREALGPSDTQVLSSMDDLALNINREGHFHDAEKLQRETLDLRRHTLGSERPETLKSMSALATTLALEGHYKEAEELQRETAASQSRVLGPERPETLLSLSNLANTLNREGRYAEAEPLQREVLNVQRRVLGREHPQTIASLGSLAATLSREGRWAEAEGLQRETLELRQHVLGLEHPDTLIAMTDLAATVKRERRLGEAEKLERGALEIQSRTLGADHPSTLMSMNNLAATLNAQGRPAEAGKLLRTSIEIKSRVLGPEHPETVRSMVNLATTLMKEGRYLEAEKLEREALDIRRRILGPEHPDVALATYNLAIIKEREGKPGEAVRLLAEAVDHGLSAGNSMGIEKDPDLNRLHGDPRFAALVTHAKERAAAAHQTGQPR